MPSFAADDTTDWKSSALTSPLTSANSCLIRSIVRWVSPRSHALCSGPFGISVLLPRESDPGLPLTNVSVRPRRLLAESPPLNSRTYHSGTAPVAPGYAVQTRYRNQIVHGLSSTTPGNRSELHGPIVPEPHKSLEAALGASSTSFRYNAVVLAVVHVLVSGLRPTD